jgi:hypothetical protein
MRSIHTAATAVVSSVAGVQVSEKYTITPSSSSEPPRNRDGTERDSSQREHDEQPSTDDPHARVQERPTEHLDTFLNQRTPLAGFVQRTGEARI